MPQPYTWQKLESAPDSVQLSGRSGHSISAQSCGMVCFAGMDGRKDDYGRVSPNNEVFLLSLSDGMYS